MTVIESHRLSRDQLETLRFQAAALLKAGASQTETAKRCRVSRMAVVRWSKQIQAGGLDALRKRHATGRPSRLTMEQWREVYRTKAPKEWTCFTLQFEIYAVFDIKFSADHAGRKLRILRAESKEGNHA